LSGFDAEIEADKRHCEGSYQRSSKRIRTTAGIAACVIVLTSPGILTVVYAGETETPIEHVVIIIGENRSFDHLFATYPPRPGEYVWNLLSKGIITAEGTQLTRGRPDWREQFDINRSGRARGRISMETEQCLISKQG
jgi:hypothetical protein